MSPSGTGPLLPFDTLLVDISLHHKCVIAQARSHAILLQLPKDAVDIPPHSHTHKPAMVARLGAIRLGFISFDFNDHPTAHLVEGIFSYAKTLQKLFFSKTTIELYVYNYGKNDQSLYRKNLEQVLRMATSS